VSKNQKNTTRELTNPHRDLPLQARLAMVDYLYELRRQNKGVQKMPKGKPIAGLVADPFKVPDWKDDTEATTRVEKLKYAKGEAPAIAYVRSLGMNALVASQVADEVGCSVQLVRKLQKDDSFKAPSFQVPYGKNKIFLYTPEDVEEIRQYVINQRKPKVRET
jgi:hypothetical protein